MWPVWFCQFHLLHLYLTVVGNTELHCIFDCQKTDVNILSPNYLHGSDSEKVDKSWMIK